MSQDESSGSGRGPNVAVIAAVVLLLGGTAGVLWFVTRKTEEPKVITVQSTTVTTTVTAPPTTQLELPPIDTVVDSGAPAEDTAPVVEAGPKAAVGDGTGGCPATCTGDITPELKEAAAMRAGTAKKCYQTALEGNEGLTGDMTVQLRVGTGGQPCSVAIVSDSTGSSRLQQCVRARMTASYPKPRGGCVSVNVPINFMKK